LRIWQAEDFTPLLPASRYQIREAFACTSRSDSHRSASIYREVGFKVGRWRDLGWWQRLL
jgi:hypothetical protein